MRSVRVSACILVLIVMFIVTGCAKPDPMPGKWGLYIPPDMKAAALKSNSVVPTGQFEFKPNGDCLMAIDDRGIAQTFKGTYTRTDIELTIDGTLTIGEKSDKLTARGSLSSDFKTLRINGKDFQKVD